jgi:hypothetical protein
MPEICTVLMRWWPRSKGWRRRRGAHRVYNAAGYDVIVDDPRAARLLRDQDKGSPNIERPSFIGFEDRGVGFDADTLED